MLSVRGTGAMQHTDTILEMRGINKIFPGVHALKNARLAVRRGEIHALIGENGAGKSTLMNCLSGMFPPTSGDIVFAGKAVGPYSASEALRMGISMIHQELSPVPYLSIAENIWLGREPKNRFAMIDHRAMSVMTVNALRKIGVEEPPGRLMAGLTVAKMQMIEIAKAISYNARLIIMDEPTTSLTDKETERLFDVMRALRKGGTAIIYISHKLEEVYAIADRITVMRDGEYVGTHAARDLPQRELIRLMVGREFDETPPARRTQPGEVILEVKNLAHRPRFRNVNFTLRRGEILGIAGLMGAGRSETVETLFGVRRLDAGEILIHGAPARIRSSLDAIRSGMAFLTEDRRGSGIFPMLEVWLNMAMAKLRRMSNRFDLFSTASVCEECGKYADLLRVKISGLNQRMETLSGGNQQKVLFGRWLMMEPSILILDEPTKGIDVGSKAEIHRIIADLADRGKAIIMVSSELPEILRLSNRILVMHEGRVSAIVDNGPTVTQQLIMEYATNRVQE